MRRIGKVLLIIVAAILALVLVVFGIRLINGARYPQQPMPDPHNLATYELNQPGMKVTHITGNYLNGFHLRPDRITHRGVLVVFGGSDGGPSYDQAVGLAGQGYEVLSLFFFGMPNQRPVLQGVPLEFFDEVLAYAQQNAQAPEPLTVIGSSKGAELVVALSDRYPQINNVMVFAPGAYAYQGLDFRNAGSSWSWRGQEVPYVSFQNSSPGALASTFGSMLFNTPLAYRSTYETAVANDPNAEAARIGRDGKANLVAFAGDADQMWQADVAARQLAERPGAEAFVYPGAGHIFYLQERYLAGLDLGGEPEANRRAAEDSRGKIHDFLNRWHPAVG